MKQYEFNIGDFRARAVGYTNSPGVGYIRFENSDGLYIGSIDIRTDVRNLKKMRDSIDNMIAQKSKK